MTHNQDATRVLLPFQEKIFRICTVKLCQDSLGVKTLKISFPDLTGVGMVFGTESLNSCFAPGAFDTFRPQKISSGCEISYHFLNDDSHFKGVNNKHFNKTHIIRNEDSPIEIAYLNINDPNEIFVDYQKNPERRIKLQPFINQRTLNIFCFPRKANFRVQTLGGCLGHYVIAEDEEWKVMLFDYKKETFTPGQPPIYFQKPKVSTDKLLDKTGDVTEGRLDPNNFSPL